MSSCVAQAAPPARLCGENPNRLVSLWDMVTLYGYRLSSMASLLTSFEHISSRSFERLPGGGYGADELVLAEVFLKSIRSLLPAMEELGLSFSLMYAKRVMTTWETGGLEDVLHHNMITVLHERFHDELRTTLFLYVPKEQAARYLASTKGWEEVLDRFPSSTMDVEEMNKCYALCRFSASVFHSVNAIECGLVELGKFLGVSDPKSGWTAISGRLDTLVTKTKFADLEAGFQKCFPFLEQLNGTVASLKNAWRNKISHAQGRLTVMTAEFSPEVADEIIVATRSFMRRLATEMPV